MSHRSWAGPALLVLVILGAGWVVAYPLNPNPQGSQGTISTTAGADYTVNLASAPNIGPYLVNASGFTLYFSVNDPGNGSSACTGGCLTFWPPFYAGTKLVLPPALEASDFGVATRTDGINQTTYQGYPLYYYPKDAAAGQVTGEAVHGFYACCSVPSTTTTSTSTG